MNILIGGAWPYANYKLHLGHVAGLIGGDLLARYHRAKGDKVIYVSGSDCHGTPITERAKQEGISPKEISSKYHELFVKSFEGLNFSYDLYTSTETDYHKEKVKEIVKKSYENGAIYEKVEPQAYCEHCQKFMADRELQIVCPNCGNITKGDTCDCGYSPTDEDLIGATCRECGNKTVQKDNKNLYISLSKMQGEIEKYVAENKHRWRTNAQNETEKYLREGLRDRAITRDLTWGIDVPVEGYDDKKLYVWIEAVLGYVTAAMKVCEDRELDFDSFWRNPNPPSGVESDGENDSKIYMVHGKDNITFHSIIFPAILLSLKEEYRLPDVIVSSEYLNFNNEKASKSKGNAISALDAIENLNVDTLRFHLISNGPERKDTNFTISEYVATHNNEVTNKLGNFVNRTLKFKGISEIPNGKLDDAIEEKIKTAYEEIGKCIETLEFKEAAEKAIRLVDDANKYYDDRKPWIQFKEDIDGFNDTNERLDLLALDKSGALVVIENKLDDTGKDVSGKFAIIGFSNGGGDALFMHEFLKEEGYESVCILVDAVNNPCFKELRAKNNADANIYVYASDSRDPKNDRINGRAWTAMKKGLIVEENFQGIDVGHGRMLKETFPLWSEIIKNF